MALILLEASVNYKMHWKPGIRIRSTRFCFRRELSWTLILLLVPTLEDFGNDLNGQLERFWVLSLENKVSMKRISTHSFVKLNRSLIIVLYPEHLWILMIWKPLLLTISSYWKHSHLYHQDCLGRMTCIHDEGGDKFNTWRIYFGRDGLGSISLNFKSARSGWLKNATFKWETCS